MLLIWVCTRSSLAAVRNIGNFNEALRCMDDMFLAQGKQDIYITTAAGGSILSSADHRQSTPRQLC
jgi:hypothetical protein